MVFFQYGIVDIKIFASSEAGKPSDADAAIVTDQTMAKSLLRNVASKRKRRPEALLQPKKCGKCAGCRRPVCGYCPVCLDNPKFGGSWERFAKKGCRGRDILAAMENI